MAILCHTVTSYIVLLLLESFTEDTYLPHLVCMIFGFSCSAALELSYEAQGSIDSVVLVLIGVEKRTRLVNRFHDRGALQPPWPLEFTAFGPF